MIERKTYRTSEKSTSSKKRSVSMTRDSFVFFIDQFLIDNYGKPIKVKILDSGIVYNIIPEIVKSYDSSAKKDISVLIEELKKLECFFPENMHRLKPEFSLKRHAYYHILYNFYPSVKLAYIGRAFKTNHTNVLYGNRNAESLLQTNFLRFVNLYNECLNSCNIVPINKEKNENLSKDS